MNKIGQVNIGHRRIDTRRSFEILEDVVMSLPNFSTIVRFLLVGGGKANDIMIE